MRACNFFILDEVPDATGGEGKHLDAHLDDSLHHRGEDTSSLVSQQSPGVSFEVTIAFLGTGNLVSDWGNLSIFGDILKGNA
jgi:hypothetical protein